MNKSIQEHRQKIQEAEEQLRKPGISPKRRADLTRYRNRLRKELTICEFYLRGDKRHGKR